ncbi:MAG: hypothetical protein ACRDLL_05160 [Solirubrobacterales bacterium]
MIEIGGDGHQRRADREGSNGPQPPLTRSFTAIRDAQEDRPDADLRKRVLDAIGTRVHQDDEDEASRRAELASQIDRLKDLHQATAET